MSESTGVHLKSRIGSVLPIFALLSVLSSPLGATGLETVQSLDGTWQFVTDPEDRGVSERWFGLARGRTSWTSVRVPHTWQVEAGTEDYLGIAWYARIVAGEETLKGSRVRLEFDAVYRDCTVWVNGESAGRHEGSGWTPFDLEITDHWRFDRGNQLVVRVDNRFSPHALPYGNSFDWACDGGLIRSVRLRFLPAEYIARVQVSSLLNRDLTSARVQIEVPLVTQEATREVVALLRDPDGGLIDMRRTGQEADEKFHTVKLEMLVTGPKLWHFDDPRLYALEVRLLREGRIVHSKTASFGIRRVELRDGYFRLNEEPMRLMGVEWMPGSDPRYGMAEPHWLTDSVLRELKLLNAVFTRFHWQQAAQVHEFCDREGILVQEEVPAWGPKTMAGDLELVQRQQMEEMIKAHFNHPSIFAWGLCNEIGGQTEKAHEFVGRGVEIARRLDPGRLLTWASNSLQKTPEEDASSLVDFIEWNDYYESWYGGDLGSLERNLDLIARAYPGKSLVISEYGLCECDPKNPAGDARRIEILRTHTERYRRSPVVAGAIFFDYNDYRTHIGDKGEGAFRQRVHGVADLLGRRKGSWAVLRAEASPVRTIRINAPVTAPGRVQMRVEVTTRALKDDMPSYTLRKYSMLWTAYNKIGHPMASGRIPLPDLPPGSRHVEQIGWRPFPDLQRVHVEIYRPTGYSVLDSEWLSGDDDAAPGSQ